MKLVSKRVTKHLDLSEAYSFPSAQGFGSNFDGHPRIFFASLYLLFPAITSSETLSILVNNSKYKPHNYE